MKYEVIMEAKNYALIKRGIDLEEYAVVSRLDRKTGIYIIIPLTFPIL